MTDYTLQVGPAHAVGRFPVELMTEPGDYFDVYGLKHKSIAVLISQRWQGVGGRRLATFGLSDRTRVMLVAIPPEL